MNILFIFADQLKASSLPLYGETQIKTPHIDRLAAQGTTFDNMISTHPVCCPYRSMLLTGRHPQTTGHIANWMTMRHDEIGIGDAFSNAGYKTGWIGKWHLHRGNFPGSRHGPDFVPEGRDRLGFEYWKAYNFHMTFFNGTVHTNDWQFETWDGYETDALGRYARDFMDEMGADPFCLFLSVHQPHISAITDQAPQAYYDRLPDKLTLPDNVPQEFMDVSLDMYRHYLAMTLAVDDMVGEMLDYLDCTERAQDTLVVFTSDHGTQAGGHVDDVPGPAWHRPWDKGMPYEESIHVPLIMRLPGVFEPGTRSDVLTAPVDLFPSLCGLTGTPIPKTVEGFDLSDAWRGKAGAFQQDAVLTMNFSASYNHLETGMEWRGARSKTVSYIRWLNGRTQLFDLQADPLQMTNLAGRPEAAELEQRMSDQLDRLMRDRKDELKPCPAYQGWFDNQRRVVRNAHGPLGHPETTPDWSLL